MKNFLIKTFKVFLWILGSLVFLLVLIVVALQFRQTQTYITGKAVDYLSKKTKSKIALAEINVAFPKYILLRDLYLEDQKKDTLLFSHLFKVDIDLWKLFSKQIVVKTIVLDKFTSHIKRNLPDSSFNFSFIPAAFASKDAAPAKKDTSKSTWQFSLLEVRLKDIYLTYNDEVSGNDDVIKLGFFNVVMDAFDPTKNRYKVRSVILNHTYAKIIQSKVSPAKKDDGKPLKMDIGVGEVLLSSIFLDYQNKVTGQSAVVNLGTSRLLVDLIDLDKQKLHLNSFRLYNTQIAYNQLKSIKSSVKAAKDTVVEKVQQDAAGPGWNVVLKTLDLKNDAVKLDDANHLPIDNSLDFNHLDIKDINIQIEKIKYTAAASAAIIRELSMKDKSGFKLRHFSTALVLDSVHADLSNLDLETGNSKIKDHLAIGYTSLAGIGNAIGDLKVNAQLKNTEVAVQDLLYFQPALSKQPFFAKNKDAVIKIHSGITGQVKDLKIENFDVATASVTHIALKGQIKGLPDINKTYFDLALEDFSTGKKDINAMLPAAMNPAALNLPERLSLKGFFKGFLNKFSSEANLNSSVGKVLAKVNMFPSAGKTGYKVAVETVDLDLGNLLKQQKTMGTFTLKASADGRGLSPKDVQTFVHVAVDKAVLNGYPYRNLKVDGELIKQRFIGKAAIDDQNLAFTFDGDINMEQGQEQFDFVFNLKGSALKALKVAKDDIRISGILSSKLKGNQVNTMNGKVDLRKFIIIKNGKEYPVDSMFFVSVNGGGNSNISFDSHMMSGKFNGDISLLDLPKVLQDHLDNYFSVNDTTIDKKLKPQNFSFEFVLRDPSLIREVLVPGLSELSPVSIKGDYVSAQKKLDLTLDVPLTHYTDVVVDSLSAGIHSDVSTLKYNMRIAKITKGAYNLDNTVLDGKIEKDTVLFSMSMTRPDKTRPLALRGNLTNKKGLKKLHLDPTGLILNNAAWTLPENNFLGFGKTFIANDMKLTKGSEMVSLNNVSEQNTKEPLKIAFAGFDLIALTKIISKDSAVVGGLLDGSVLLDNLQKRSVFTSDIKIKNFTYLGKPVGDIALLADNKTSDRYTVKLAVSGNNNDIKADGYYEAKGDNENLNFDVHIRPLNLSTIESFTQGQLKKVSGVLAGDLKITGSSKQPVVNGDLAFQQAGFTPAMTKSPLTLKDEHMVFNGTGIHFKSFTLLDSLKNNFTVNGAVLTQNYADYNFDLDLTSKDFLALNTKASDNELYFGKALIDSKVRVTGNPARPVVNARVKVKEGTRITVIKPETTVAAEDSKGIVLFFDPRRDKMHRIMEEGLRTDTATNKITGIDLTVDLGISDQALFKVIVDKVSGDSLIAQGNANLSLGLDPSGKTSLSGKYEISKGSYSLTVNDFIKRAFEIGKGSSITWNGDPTSAELDISAIYTAKTAPLALVEDQLAGMSEAQRSVYKKELPFQVYLYVKGDMMTPQISFGLQMPEKYRGEMGGTVYAKVQQLNQDESMLNQQVFALLVLDRFIANDPMANPGSGGLASSARSSVSKVLTDQLNSMTGKYVKGVDINVGVDSYEDNSKSGKDRNTTKVNYGVSKQLFKDKVKVQVGGNVDVEGEKASKNDLGNVVGDLSLEYKLSDDGRYLLKGLRKTQYEGAIEGELTKTGAALIYVRDYNSFWEILHKPKAMPAASTE